VDDEHKVVILMLSEHLINCARAITERENIREFPENRTRVEAEAEKKSLRAARVPW
jgi:hypothetical protein